MLVLCLAIFVVALAAGYAGARTPEESVDMLLKPTVAGGAATEDSAGVKVRQKATPGTGYAHAKPVFHLPQGEYHRPIIKVKPPTTCAPMAMAMPMAYGWQGCFLQTPRQGQWDLGFQAFFARIKGCVQWPLYNGQYYGYYGSQQNVDFNDDLVLPAHQVIPQFTARYQFRCHWGIRYSILGAQFNGGGYPNDYFYLGSYYSGYNQFNPSQSISTIWQHRYQRLGLVYDPIKTQSAAVSLFADWVHLDDTLQVSNGYCYGNCFNNSLTGDPAMVGVEVQRCSSTTANGATVSCEGKAGFLFLDDSTGWDVQAGCRYAIPMGCGRTGFVKGGYRNVTINKGNTQYVFNHSLEGGFMEFGFIF